MHYCGFRGDNVKRPDSGVRAKEIPCLGCNESGWALYCQGWTLGTHHIPSECNEAEGKCPFCGGKGKLIEGTSDPKLFGEMARALETMPDDPLERSRVLQKWEERAAEILEEKWWETQREKS